MTRLEGKAAVVTGAGRGLGRAYALALAHEGAAVLINDVDEGNAGAVVQEIEQAGGKAAGSIGSVASFEYCEQLIQTCVDRFGKIDVLVNNAGIVRDRTLMKMSEEEFDSVYAVHAKGTFACSRAAAAHFREQGGGVIINITSTSGLCGNIGQTNYSAAKAGILGMTRTWAQELARYNVRVNALAPTAVTEMVKTIPGMENLDPENVPSELRDRYLGPAEDVAPAVVFLASDASAGLNGQILALGGNRLAIWSHPMEVHHELRPGGWDVAGVEEAFQSAFRDKLQPVGLWTGQAKG
jgi:NAD(P)-dependent dehydrogenase (short-subunit alcohol dehydrogenase family)